MHLNCKEKYIKCSMVQCWAASVAIIIKQKKKQRNNNNKSLILYNLQDVAADECHIYFIDHS